jgi:hypothetical protein
MTAVTLQSVLQRKNAALQRYQELHVTIGFNMKPPPSPRLRKVLIDFLVENPATPFEGLHRHATSVLGRSLTPQAVYQLMRRLAKEGVVLKQKGKYSLRLSWVHNIVMLASRLQERYLDSSTPGDVEDLPAGGQRWTVSDLAKADDLWVNLILGMYNASDSAAMYSWLPHPWYHLIHHTAELNLQRILKRNNKQLWLLVGGDSYLDHAYSAYWDSNVYRYRFTKDMGLLGAGTYYNVIDDLVLKLQLPQDLSRHLEALYREVKSAEELLPGRVFELLSRRSRIHVTLKRNPRTAAKIRNIFLSQFEP